MLVQVQNVTLQSPGLTPDGKGRVTGNLTTDDNNGCQIDNELYDLQATDFPPGTVFASITGVVTYFYNYHISPRSPADFVVQTLGTSPEGGTAPVSDAGGSEASTLHDGAAPADAGSD
jgi:hypothetical protein